jgi:hypothetical protein
VQTDSSGNFADQLNAVPSPPLASGTWPVQASYAGVATHAPGSQTQNVIVP